MYLDMKNLKLIKSNLSSTMSQEILSFPLTPKNLFASINTIF